jgi:hypothetical protein
MYAAALHRLPPAYPCRGCPSLLRRQVLARGLAAVSQCGRDACHPLPAATGAILPMGFRNRVQRDPTQASHAANN